MDASVANETVTISFEGLRNELRMDEVIQQLASIRTATVLWGAMEVANIRGLGGHIDGVSDTISKLKMYLDTGVLVGELTPMIDKKLYEDSLLSDYTGG